MSRIEASTFLCRCLNPAGGKGIKEFLHEALRSPGFSWEELVVIASEQGVSAMMTSLIAKHELTALLPSDLIDYFEGMETLNRQRNDQIRDQAIEIAGILNGIGVTPIFLKGAGNLLAGLYDEPSHRVMIDIDILVPHGLLFDCVAALRNSGYGEHDEDIVADPRSHHYPPLFMPGRVAEVELHSEVVAYPHDDLLSAEEIIANRQHIEKEGVTFAVPNVEHRIIHTIVHSQVTDRNYLHGFIMVRQLVECLLLQRAASQELNWPSMEARFASAGEPLPYACQVFALNDLFQAGWPAPKTSYWIARYFHKYALAQIGRPRTASFLSRLIKPISLLNRSIVDQRLRARLWRNLFKPAWIYRQLRSFTGR